MNDIEKWAKHEKDLKENLQKENTKLKNLLNLAVADIEKASRLIEIGGGIHSNLCSVCSKKDIACKCCGFRWEHADEIGE